MGATMVDTSAGSLAAGGMEEHETRVKGSAQMGQPPEPYVLKRIQRSESAVARHEPRWRELWAHFDGDQYVERSTTNNNLVRVETREGGSKKRWRSRLVRNRMTKSIMGEVSVVSSRMPTWEVTPSNGDRQMRSKAELAEKILLYLTQKLKVRSLIFGVCQVAAVTGDGYLFPYWDPTVGSPVLEEPGGQAAPVPPGTGPPAPPGAAEYGQQAMGAQQADGLPPGPSVKRYSGKRTGEIKVKVLRQDQVLWQPNQSFDESRYYCVRDAQPAEDIKADIHAMQGGHKGDRCLCMRIKPDASAATIDMQDGDGKPDLVFKYHYFERPSDDFPDGRYLCIANRFVIGEVYPYPVGEDIPCIHRMPWIDRKNRDRGLGIGEMAIDIQRSINRIVNQLIAWRNLALNPQLLAPEGSMKTVATDEPGVVLEYRPYGGKEPKWRDVPEIPVSLFKDLEQAYADMDFVVGGSASLPPGVEAGSAIQAVNEREQSFRAQVISNLATLYSSFGRHLLCLVKQHYTEERLIVINGRFGVDMIDDFLGEQLGGQNEEFADVRVAESSITPRTRAEMEAKIMLFADKGWIPPQMAMGALQGGTVEVILDRFERDEAKAHRHITQLILIGRGEIDPGLVPEAGPMDNHAVQNDVRHGVDEDRRLREAARDGPHPRDGPHQRPQTDGTGADGPGGRPGRHARPGAGPDERRQAAVRHPGRRQ